MKKVTLGVLLLFGLCLLPDTLLANTYLPNESFGSVQEAFVTLDTQWQRPFKAPPSSDGSWIGLWLWLSRLYTWLCELTS
ncbi:MAG: hypothetical protein ACFCUI_12725 [Bernardetiaceae bacterium]